MSRLYVFMGAALVLAACESSLPLMKEDGQYRPSRDEAAQARQAAENARRIEAENAQQVAAFETIQSAFAVPAPTAPSAVFEAPQPQPGLANGPSDLPEALTNSAPPRISDRVSPAEIDAILADLDQETASARRINRPNSRRIEPAATAPSRPQIQPLSTPTAGTQGPYFVSDAPASLPPTRQAAPAIVGQAATGLPSTVARPTVRRAPVVASRGPAALDRPITSLPQDSARAAVQRSTTVDSASVDLQRTAALQALTVINAYRAERGLAPLAYNQALSQVAQRHVMDLANRGIVTAKSASGEAIGARLLRDGYVSSVASSLVAGGYPTFQDAFDSWIQDNVESSRLLLPSATEMGFAVITDPGSTYRTYIETVIAAPQQ